MILGHATFERVHGSLALQSCLCEIQSWFCAHSDAWLRQSMDLRSYFHALKQLRQSSLLKIGAKAGKGLFKRKTIANLVILDKGHQSM